MNFSFRRFALTLKKDASDHRRGLLTFLAGSMTLIFVADSIITIANAHLRMESLTATVGSFNVFFILLAATLATSTSFSFLGKKSSATSVLMLPASDMEKFLSQWLIAVPGVLLLLATEAFVGDILVSWLSKLIYNVGHGGTFGWINYSRHMLDLPMFISSLLFLQSFFFLGSLLWPRFSWGKSLVCLTLMAVISILVVMEVVTLTDHHFPVMNLQILGREELIVVMLTLAVIFYVVSFFRFREAEINNRW